MAQKTCRYCGEPVHSEKRNGPRVHEECRDAAHVCRYCESPVKWPKRVHPECREQASRVARELAAEVSRRCPKCRKVKAPSSFSDDSSRIDGKYPYCMSCQSEDGKAGNLQDSSAELNGKTCPVCDTQIRGRANRVFCGGRCRDKARSLRRNFGLTVDDYRRLVDETGGRCPICGNRCKAWNVDHDHATGRVTGVVCARCNVGLLAYSNHLVERAQALVSYLFETPAERLGIEAEAPANAPDKPSQLHKGWNRRNGAA